MSENAFVAAIRPNVYGSSTSGVKKSIVCTTARSSEMRHTAASSRPSWPTMSCADSTRGSPASTSRSEPAGSLQAQPAPCESSVRRTSSVAISDSVYAASDERHGVRLAPPRPVGCLDDEALRIGAGVDERDHDVALERIGVDRPPGHADRLAVAGGDRPVLLHHGERVAVADEAHGPPGGAVVAHRPQGVAPDEVGAVEVEHAAHPRLDRVHVRVGGVLRVGDPLLEARTMIGPVMSRP